MDEIKALLLFMSYSYSGKGLIVMALLCKKKRLTDCVSPFFGVRRLFQKPAVEGCYLIFGVGKSRELDGAFRVKVSIDCLRLPI